MGSLSRKQKKQLIRILIAAALFAAIVVLEHAESFNVFLYAAALLDGIDHHLIMLVLYMIPYLVVGIDVIRKCFIGILHGQMFDESFLMTLATIGAFGCREFEEAVAVMLFYQVGEFFQSYAVGKSRNSIQELMSIAPEFANRELDDGSVEIIDPDEVAVGDILVVRAGEKIPVDAVVVSGEGLINTSALTGESMPQYVRIGDAVISGCINGDNLIRIRALKEYDDSTVALILEMVENAAGKKSKTEAFITRFARYYTPIVVISGAVLAFVPPIFVGNLGMWILRACTFLVISCPCALVISVPLAFFGGIGAASRNGILVKGSNYLEMMAQLNTLVTDKTGTLTEGRFAVSDVVCAGDLSQEELLRYAAAVELASTHPIGASIIEACSDEFAGEDISEAVNIPGKGVTATVRGRKVAAGNAALMAEMGIEIPDGIHELGTVVFVSIDGEYAGYIKVEDSPKPEVKTAIEDIIKEKVEHIVMLTGDAEEAANRVAAELGISDVRSELLPQDKVSAVEELLGTLTGKNYLAYVGDGINDAPVLSRADIGIAMGSLGSDAAIEAADIVIMDDNIRKIPMMIRIARKTVAISKVNIAFALAVKIACLILGALGIANMWVAVFADVGVAMICILNSMRMLVKRAY